MSKWLSGKYERRERDFYATPGSAVLPLVPHLRAARVRRFCEPCAGEGDLVRCYNAGRGPGRPQRLHPHAEILNR